MEPVGVDVDAAAERDEPVAPSHDEELLVVALGEAGVVLLSVAVGNRLSARNGLAVQPRVVRVDERGGSQSRTRICTPRWPARLNRSSRDVPGPVRLTQGSHHHRAGT